MAEARPRLEELLEDLEFLSDPMERLRALMDLADETLSDFPEAARDAEHLVRGCTSQVWISWEREAAPAPDGSPRLVFRAEADAQIVRGLAALLLLVYSGRSAHEILDTDIEAIFQRAELERQLTPGRQNGLRAMVGRIQAIARDALD